MQTLTPGVGPEPPWPMGPATVQVNPRGWDSYGSGTAPERAFCASPDHTEKVLMPMSRNLETARRYLEASFSDDVEACAQLIADGYSFADHTKPSVASTTEALLQALQDDLWAWSDKDLVIERMMETSDGSTVITQFCLTETHTGTYKSVPATGVRVTFSACNLLTFDAEGKIIAEESYYDDLRTMLQLGAVRRVGDD
jgi:steroid delta-isomerase-like uncharacterized protein